MNFDVILPQRFLGKILRFPLRFIPKDLKVPLWHGKLRGQWWIVGSSNHGYWLGIYEPAKRVIFESMVKEGQIVFDIGAHVGYYTLLSSILVGPMGQVFAFEPLPENLFYLKEHLRLNRITNVTVIDAAVDYHCGNAFFSKGRGFSRVTSHLSPQGEIEVQTIGLDESIGIGQLPIPDILKIDVEGAEGKVLSGARQTLSQYHPTIFLDTHGAAIHQECCELLTALGYSLQLLDRKHTQYYEVLAYIK